MPRPEDILNGGAQPPVTYQKTEYRTAHENYQEVLSRPRIVSGTAHLEKESPEGKETLDKKIQAYPPREELPQATERLMRLLKDRFRIDLEADPVDANKRLLLGNSRLNLKPNAEFPPEKEEERRKKLSVSETDLLMNAMNGDLLVYDEMSGAPCQILYDPEKKSFSAGGEILLPIPPTPLPKAPAQPFLQNKYEVGERPPKPSYFGLKKFLNAIPFFDFYGEELRGYAQRESEWQERNQREITENERIDRENSAEQKRFADEQKEYEALYQEYQEAAKKYAEDTLVFQRWEKVLERNYAAIDRGRDFENNLLDKEPAAHTKVMEEYYTKEKDVRDKAYQKILDEREAERIRKENERLEQERSQKEQERIDAERRAELEKKYAKYGGQEAYIQKLQENRTQLLDLIGRIPDPEEEFNHLRQSKKGRFFTSKIKWDEMEDTFAKKIYYGRLAMSATEMISLEDPDQISPDQIKDALDNPETIRKNLDGIKQSPQFKDLMDSYKDRFKTPENFFDACDLRSNKDVLDHFMKGALSRQKQENAAKEQKARDSMNKEKSTVEITDGSPGKKPVKKNAPTK